MMSNFMPELDGTPELNEKDLTFYQELIGILRWATEIGRVDILLEVSLLSQYIACAQEGHLEQAQALQIMAYLKKKTKLTLYMDPCLPTIDYSQFRMKPEDFTEHYQDAEEEIMHRMPKAARGRSVTTTAFVDASHDANRKTRKSHTGFLIFLNRAPVIFYRKQQQTVDASTFSSEFI
eukprot:scaffold10628_cov48-Attheya_sp.AAC.3